MRALNRVFKGRARGDQPTLPAKVKRILRKYGATLLMPGPSGILQYGLQPNNYRESTGQNLAAADQQVGLVVDAAGSAIDVFTATFESGTDGFTAVTGDTSIYASGGVLTTTATNASVGGAQRFISTTANRRYEVVARIRNIDATDVRVRAVDSYFGGTLLAESAVVTSASFTDVRCSFVAASSTTSIYLRSAATVNGKSGQYEIVSVRELHGVHASQATSGYQPVLRQSGGVNSWQFDGVDDRLSLSAVPFQTQDVSFAIVAFMPLAADGGVGRRLFEFGGNGSEIALLTSNAGLLFNVRGDTGNQSSINGGATATNTPFVATCIQAGSSRSLRVDSVPKGSNAVIVSSSTANAATLGNRAAGDRPFNGPQHIQIFGKGAITEAELLTLEKFIAKLQGRSL